LTLKNNPYSWNEASNLLFVDQPVGTGFSKCASIFDFDTNEDQIAATMKLFLDGFLEKNPEFKGRDFYITGESYAGHYIPALAYHFVKEIPPGSLGLNFKGIAIGNGWVDPYIQYPQYAEFAYENSLVTFEQYLELKTSFVECQRMIDDPNENWLYSLEYCQLTMAVILGNPLAPNFNVYDIRKKCDKPPLCYDLSNSDKFLNNVTIQQRLGISPQREWVECDQEVHTEMLGDWLTNLATKIQAVLETGLKVLVYSGDKDFVCNWRGGEAWTNAVTWSGQQEFNNAQYKDWLVNGQPAGQLKEYKNFQFLRVFNAGHMVPMDQPVNALNML
jgi:cathepsin A (carboxypeptidase C)